MTRTGSAVVLLVWTCLFTPAARGDDAVSCVFAERCDLPCTFTQGPQVVIHWIQSGTVQVHSFYQGRDQTGHQDLRYRGRTALFRDQIPRGNASLRLTGLEVADQGRYKCYTSTIDGNKESFINLKVNAPVRKVDIQQVGDTVTCRSDGVYPEPRVSWSNQRFPITTDVKRTKEQLYDITSSLVRSGDADDSSFSCSISTESSSRRASVRTAQMNVSSSEVKLSCGDSDLPLPGVIWTFNHSQVILTRDRPGVPFTASDRWGPLVKDVSPSGDLMLMDVSSEHDGTYTCEVSDANESMVTNTVLRIQVTDHHTNITGGAVGGAVGLVALLGAAGFINWNRRRRSKNNVEELPEGKQLKNPEQEPMKAALETESM